MQVSPKCAAHVQRVMHQRAVDVHLMPDIQTACVQDLAKLCSDQLGKGEVLNDNENTVITLWKDLQCKPVTGHDIQHKMTGQSVNN